MNKLSDYLSGFSNIEVDELSDGLSILSPKGQYLLNYHSIAGQLWLSSPLSGAHHFALKANDWVCTRQGVLLNDLLEEEFMQFGCMLHNFN